MKTVHLFTRLGIAFVVVALLAAGLSVTVTSAQVEPDTFYGGWPYSPPPKGNLNSFIPDGLPVTGVGIYADLLEMPGGIYLWAKGTYAPLLAEKWGFEGSDKWVMSINRNAKWSDGSPVTSKDVVATFNLGRLRNIATFTYVDKVTARDDYTVEFSLKSPSTVVERTIMRYNIRAAATYGAIADKVQAFVDAGKDRTGANKEEWDALVKELTDFRPNKVLTSGPYTLDLADVTDSQLTLRKNANSHFAEKAKFNKVVLYNGETEAVTPLFLAKEMYYGTYFFPPATEKAMIEAGFQILRTPTYSGPGLFFNQEVYPLNRVEVRQAIAHAIERSQAAVVGYGQSGNPPKYMAGISDSLLPLWVSEETVKQLNPYDYNVEGAAKLLEGIGFKKQGDVWVDDQGKPMEFELMVPSDFTDWVPVGENAAEQLTAFGIKTTLRGVPNAQMLEEVKAGNFQMGIRLWGIGNPHPFFAYRNMLIFNTVGKLPTDKGFSFPLKQMVDGREVDLEALLTATGAGVDLEVQKKAVSEMALAFNKLLPGVPLVERYGNTPLLTERISGVPPEGDPIYQNSFGADSYIVLWLIDGTIGPK